MADEKTERRAPRRVCRRWTRAREDTFFAALAETANVRQAATLAGIANSVVYARRHDDAAFAARWLTALEAGYARLEVQLLDQSLNGFERVETVRGGDGAVKQVKTVRCFPHGPAMRLLSQHRQDVEAFRVMQAMRDGDDPDAAAKIRSEMDRVRARLRGDTGEDMAV